MYYRKGETKVLPIVVTAKNDIDFKPSNGAKFVSSVDKLEDIFRNGEFDSIHTKHNTLEMIVRSSSETSIEFYKELLSSNNYDNCNYAIRGLGKLSPSKDAYLVLVEQFNFKYAIDHSLKGKLQASILNNMRLNSLDQIRLFPYQMTMGFLNKVIENTKHNDIVKNKARRIIESNNK